MKTDMPYSKLKNLISNYIEINQQDIDLTRGAFRNKIKKLFKFK